ncbi:MAG: hypothetical protein MUE46_00365 [Xanthomonadales bacterium]|nr:hypothetical protein [Xanthomonadales bacterium]
MARPLWFVLLAALLLGGCASTTPRHAEGIQSDSRLGEGRRILLMPLDVELAELLASGLAEPRQAWTEAATRHLDQAFRAELAERGAEVVAFDPTALEESAAARARQLELLHEVVASSLLMNELGPARLPTKPRYEWTLGPGVQVLSGGQPADYAMFTLVRDSYASGGRKALMVIGLVAGVGVSLGQQVGFVSLVDLRTGQLVWSNFLVSGSGDLREADSAAKAAQQLLAKLPL